MRSERSCQQQRCKGRKGESRNSIAATDAGSGDALCHADLFLAAELR
jgi:hypothetical protein